jgi:sulfate adenylyltransferase subunit 1
VTDAATAFVNIAGALQAFADHAALDITAIVPVSALKGLNVVNPEPNWCNYSGPSLLQLLESLPVTAYEEDAGLAFAVQWVEKFHDSADTSKGRRVYWGRVGAGIARPGDSIRVFPSGQTAVIKEVLNSVRQPTDIAAGHSAGLVLDREVDISRGDWVLAQHHDAPSQNPLNVTLAWLDDEPLVAGRVYWALHGHRWVKAKVLRIVHRLDVNSLQELEASELPPNAIGHVQLSLQQPLVTLPFEISRSLGSLVLVDTATHKTSAAVMVRE